MDVRGGRGGWRGRREGRRGGRRTTVSRVKEFVWKNCTRYRQMAMH